MRNFIPVSDVLLAALAIVPLATAAEPAKDANGFFVHTLKSEFQSGETLIRLLLPDQLQMDRRYPVIYLLPVEAKDESRYGNGLLEVKKHDLHNKHQVIFAAPTFAQLPWYADHPTDKSIRQESYFIKDVVPLVEKNYPATAECKGRLLLGFSKSGWGAWTLLLRNGDLFGKAAAFDAPMMMDVHDRFGAGSILGTAEHFAHYRIVNLLEKAVDKLGTEKRLILLGVGSFKADHEKIHALMDEKKIPHVYTDRPTRKHDWHSGWVAEGVDLLLK